MVDAVISRNNEKQFDVSKKKKRALSLPFSTFTLHTAFFIMNRNVYNFILITNEGYKKMLNI